MALSKRKLGNSGLEIAPVVFGGNVFGWTADEATSFHLLDAFVAAGFNAVDTADVYSKWVPGNRGGESETIIGKWLKRSKKRQRVIIATKVGSEMGQERKDFPKATFWPRWKIRCNAWRPTTSIYTSRMLMTPIRRWMKRSKRTRS